MTTPVTTVGKDSRVARIPSTVLCNPAPSISMPMPSSSGQVRVIVLSGTRYGGAGAALPHSTQRHGDRLTVHRPGGIRAQEGDHLRDLNGLEHALLWINGGAFAPHLLSAYAASFSFRLRRT